MARLLGTNEENAEEHDAAIYVHVAGPMTSDDMKNKGTALYEYLGIIIPGSCFLFGLFFVLPEIKQVFLREGFSLSVLVLFLLIAYAAGHLISDVGDLIEKIWWKLQGGMPSEWPIVPGRNFLSDNQRQRLLVLLRARLGVEIDELTGLSGLEWHPVLTQMHDDLLAAGRAARIDMINADYGLSRGIAAATLTVAGLNLLLNVKDWDTTLGFTLAGGVALFRMHRSAVHYGKEMILQFLQLPELRRSIVANDFGGKISSR